MVVLHTPTSPFCLPTRPQTRHRALCWLCSLCHALVHCRAIEKDEHSLSKAQVTGKTSCPAFVMLTRRSERTSAETNYSIQGILHTGFTQATTVAQSVLLYGTSNKVRTLRSNEDRTQYIGRTPPQMSNTQHSFATHLPKLEACEHSKHRLPTSVVGHVLR